MSTIQSIRQEDLPERYSSPHAYDRFLDSHIAIRIEYFVFNYFIKIFDVCHFGAQTIYWGLQDLTFSRWWRHYTYRVEQLNHTPLFQEEPRADEIEFISSSQLENLREVFPLFEQLQHEKEKSHSLFNFQCGTCFGQAFAAMHYHRYFNTRTGFTGIPREHDSYVKNKVIFLQALHAIKNTYEDTLKNKKKLEDKRIAVNDLYSRGPQMQPESQNLLKILPRIDKMRLFHFLRIADVPRLQALYMSNNDMAFELFSYSAEMLTQKIAQCDQLIRQEVDPLGNLSSQHLNFDIFSTKENYSQKTQQEMDLDVCSFFSQNNGPFKLTSLGQRNIGHAMFVKIEKDRCIVLDPATDVSFITPRTQEGILKILELMKRLLCARNFGGKFYYSVAGFD